METKEKLFKKFDTNKKDISDLLRTKNIKESYKLVRKLKSETDKLLSSDEVADYVGYDEIAGIKIAKIDSNDFARELQAQLDDLEIFEKKLLDLKMSMDGFCIRDNYTID